MFFLTLGLITSINVITVTIQNTIQSAIERADRAMYAAKDAGCNRTVACEAHV